MKTAIRIITDFSGNYDHFYIQVLTNQKYPTVAGYIHWQGNKEDKGNNWYSRSYTVENGKLEYLQYMAKVAKVIEDNCYYSAQPSEIINLIGGVEYFSANLICGLYPVSSKGMNVYKVIRNNSHYTTIIAANKIVATKLLAKEYNNIGELEEIGILS